MALCPSSISLNSPIDTSSPAQPVPGSPMISSFGSPAPSIAPSDSASAIGLHSALHSWLASYNDLCHLHTTPHSLGHFEVNLNVNWNTGRQRLFEENHGQVTAACGFLLSWVDNPEWIAFCDEFIPAAHLPSHNTLSRWIIQMKWLTFKPMLTLILRVIMGLFSMMGGQVSIVIIFSHLW